jgi:hypothetical protein
MIDGIYAYRLAIEAAVERGDEICGVLQVLSIRHPSVRWQVDRGPIVPIAHDTLIHPSRDGVYDVLAQFS